MKKKVYIGPAGWSYKDWEGIVYPAQKGKNFDPLRYLSHFFDVIEINNSFYRPPTANMAQSWTERVKDNRDFTFTCKLWQEYTHNRNHFPGEAEEMMVKRGLDILRNSGRLGALLIQFPWSFKNTPDNLAWLERILKIFKAYFPVVEVRHQSWYDEMFFDFLNEHDAAFANIDQPVIGKSIPLTAHASKHLSYLRLHGRNKKNWFAKDADVASRYDYLYDEHELMSIKKKIEDMMESSPRTYIIFNNHYRGQAVANSLQTIYLLQGKKIEVPQSLLETYPPLKEIATSETNDTGQTSLF